MASNGAYRLLIVAYDASLIHIHTFTKNLRKENPLAIIHVLTNRKLDSITCGIKDYVNRIIRIRECRFGGKSSRIAAYLKKFSLLFSAFRLSFKRYDVVNIHFAKPSLLKAMPLIQRMTGNIIISPWGSDVLRLEDERAISRMRMIYSYASGVTISPTYQLGAAIVEKFNYDPHKMYTLRWGVEYVDFIEEVNPNTTVEEAKAQFGLSGRYVITCGYSSSPSHQHGTIIDAVSSIRDDLPDNLTLLFPFTYGWASREYVQSIKDKCHSLGLDAVFVEEYLSMENLYDLRMATDMFVHIQISDAGAACVMQYILCHKKIIHGAWMKYTDLEEIKPLFYYPVVKLDDLAGVILNAYHSEGIDIPRGVIDAIMDRSWKKEIKKWDSLFRTFAH